MSDATNNRFYRESGDNKQPMPAGDGNPFSVASPTSLRVGNMTEREMIERLMFRAKDCLDAQAQYFKSRMQFDLRKSKRKESLLRNAIYALRKRGYEPSADTEAEQLKLSQNVIHLPNS
jgi:hypothetical protein